MLTQILDIVSRRSPCMTVSDALEMSREIEELVSPNTVQRNNVIDSVPLSFEMIRAATWAERRFSREDMNRKIQVIKEIRNEWHLGLKQAKDIADNVVGCSARSYWD